MRPTSLLICAAAVLASSAAANSGFEVRSTAHSPLRQKRHHAEETRSLAEIQEERDAAEEAPAVYARNLTAEAEFVDVAARGYLAARQSSLRWPYGGASLGQKTVRGVNLGGWLTTEPFITPSLYDATGPSNNGIIDEWTFASKQPRDKATRLLQYHLNTFVTQQDFIDIKAAGLNHVRIPIGYWAFETQGDEPYLKLNQWSLLKQAVGWAQAAGLRVMPELHGAPGSQNPFDHSGRKQSTQHWTDKQSNIDRTLSIIRTMAVEFSKSEYASTVVAIELLNEPLGLSIEVLKQFYRDGYRTIRDQGNIVVVLSDGFKTPGGSDYQSTWAGYKPASNANGVILDGHIYSIFSDNQIRYTAAQRQAYYCNKRGALSQANRDNLWTIIGEWTPAFTDCATYLNGRGLGSRYDGTYPGSTRYGSCDSKRGDGSNYSDAYKKLLARFFSVQRDTYEAASGWILWTWKTENNGDWSYKAGMKYGWIPKTATGSVSDFHC